MAPIFLLNGFYVKGYSRTFNVGGTNSRKDLLTHKVLVKDSAGTIIGCTANLLT